MKIKKSIFLSIFLSIFIIIALLFIPNTVDAINKYPEIDGIKYSLNESTHTAKVEDYYGSNSELEIPSEIESEGIKYTVTSIIVDAFENLSMTKIKIPKTITTIGNGAFNNCINLTSIEVDNLNENYCSVGGILFNKDKTTIIRYPEAKEETTYIIPNSVKTIDKYAFYRAKNLTDITIPNNVETIGVSAFNTCSSLTSIAIPDGVQAIESGTFYQCTSLESVILPKNLKEIGTQAFFNCISLKSITIPETLESTGMFAFSYCTSLTISGYPNSLEKTFATNNNINFEPKYTVTNRLNNITASNENIGINYTTTLKANSGYKLPGNIKIIINNTELEEEKHYTYDRTNGNIVIFDTAIIGDIEIEAIGEKLIKVSFDANGGLFGDKTTYTIDEWVASLYDTLTTPTREGYIFKGYYTEKNGGTKFEMILNESGIDSDMTFYAQWEEDLSGVEPGIPEGEEQPDNNDNNTRNTDTNPGANNNNITTGNNPQTSDNILFFVGMLFIAVIGITVTTKFRNYYKTK